MRNDKSILLKDMRLSDEDRTSVSNKLEDLGLKGSIGTESNKEAEDIIKESDDLVSMIRIFSDKISKLREKLNSICKHPLDRIYVNSSYLTDTLGNNGRTNYYGYCGICDKYLFDVKD